MKITYFFSVLAVWLFISSCSHQIYSHQQVMYSYRTKADVIRQFGQPDEIMISKDTVQWLYNCSTTSTFALTKTKVKVNGIYNSPAGVSSTPASVTQFTHYEKYVKFTFNKEGEVLGWNSLGLNFAQRKRNSIATIGIITASVAVVVLIVASIDYNNTLDAITAFGQM